MIDKTTSDLMVIHPSHCEILREVVKSYPGILCTTNELVNELTRDPIKWGSIIQEMKSYALKNFYIHDHHERGIEAVSFIVDIFFKAFSFDEVTVKKSAIDSLLFYLEKILFDSRDITPYAPVFNTCFTRFNQLPEKEFFIIVTNPHQLKKLGQLILNTLPQSFDLGILAAVLMRYFSATYEYWLHEEDPAEWLMSRTEYIHDIERQKESEETVYPISHAYLRELLVRLKDLADFTDRHDLLEQLLSLPGYMQQVKFYEDISNSLPKTGDAQKDFTVKLSFLLKMLETKGLSSVHDSTLREINRIVSSTIKMGKPPEDIQDILSEILRVLKSSLFIYPAISLYCIQSIGNEIYAIGNSSLVEWFIQKIISLGFEYPRIEGTTDEWQIKSNRAHLENIRVWLALIENNPKWSKSLISALIVHLSLGGVHIRDTDLFQKDITTLLNSDIKPVYHLVKQLCKLFPVYFSEIGAEGALREISTEIDELSVRADRLVHFIRKQCHVESSSRIVDFMEEIIYFWRTKDKTPLKGFLPEEVYERITASGPYFDELNIIFNVIFNRGKVETVTDLITLSEDEIHALIGEIPDISDQERKRAFLAVRFYQLLHQKYRLNIRNITDQLMRAQGLGLPNPDSLVRILNNGTVYQKLEGILTYLQLLKDIILSSERYEAIENIFRKRHIAAGIPSMYGNYHERKFDALALTFRLENLVNTLLEEALTSFNPNFITRATLFKINAYTLLFFKVLTLDGIKSNRLQDTLELLSGALEVRRFSFSQYIDIFKGFSEAVQDIVNTDYAGMHKNNLKNILRRTRTETMLQKYSRLYTAHNEDESMNKVSEQFLREALSGSFGLQQLDTFVSNILKTLFEQEKGLDADNLSLLMSYDPEKSLSDIYHPDTSTFDRIHLGNKGYNLIRMSSLGIPVPQGFIVTTEVFRCLKAINRFQYAKDHLNEKIMEQIRRLERTMGKRFGDPDNALLVSVRSGGALSMPGMMNSFLNVGINESIVTGLIKQTGKQWFAWDCYRRFLQFWGMFFGMERDIFDSIINSFKNTFKTTRKIEFTPEQMKEVACAYRDAVRDRGIDITDDPEAQLNTVISQVFESWYSDKAQTYREITGFSENWGTAVIIQSMVYGNLDTNSGAGVVFTRNPNDSGDRVMLWGDFARANQGDDIVSGLVKTLPISNEQKNLDGRTADTSLEDSSPEIYEELLNHVNHLIYTEEWGAQDIEFTFEGKKRENLFILQTRDMTVTRKESIMAFVPSKELTSSYLSKGIGVGGGALSGRVVFDFDEIQEFREKYPSTPLILVRSDTVPDDIRHISAADGLLTARGGSTSHAAIIANRLGKTCVVGCNNLSVWELEKRCKLNEKEIHSGDFISIDGRNGSVYSDRHQVKEIRIMS